MIKNNRLTSHQSGNRKFHSTETLSLLVSDHICKAMDKKQITAMVLIDLSKAFDSLCHLNFPVDTNRQGRELFHQTCFDGEANPMYPVLALSLSFPKEGVATGWFCEGSFICKPSFT